MRFSVQKSRSQERLLPKKKLIKNETGVFISLRFSDNQDTFIASLVVRTRAKTN